MHPKRWLSGILLSVALPVLSQAQNTNFPLSFPPALYPLANSGKLDGAITGLGGAMSVPGPSVKFGGVSVTVRQPFNSVFAMDMVLGGAGLATNIPDGVTPITVSYANWGHTIPFGYQANGAGNLSGTVLNAALDLEFRPLIDACINISLCDCADFGAKQGAFAWSIPRYVTREATRLQPESGAAPSGRSALRPCASLRPLAVRKARRRVRA